jgi:hypothetical protein
MRRSISLRAAIIVGLVGVLAVCSTGVGGAQQAAGHRNGQPMIRPETPASEATYGFLRALPTHRFLEPGRVELTFETREPTPPARIYLGLNPLKDDLDYPLYRTSAVEEGDVTDLRTQHRFVIDLAAVTRYLHTTPFENRVTYRIEA